MAAFMGERIPPPEEMALEEQQGRPLFCRLTERDTGLRLGLVTDKAAYVVYKGDSFTFTPESDRNLEDFLDRLAEWAAPQPEVGEEVPALHAAAARLVDAMDDCAYQVPKEFLCPITLRALRVPGVAADGFTYEWEAITKALLDEQRSPTTGAQLATSVVFVNHAVRALIDEFALGRAETLLGRPREKGESEVDFVEAALAAHESAQAEIKRDMRVWLRPKCTKSNF